MRLVNECNELFSIKVIEQGVRSLSWHSTIEKPRVVLDSRAVTNARKHLHIVCRTLLQSLSFEIFPLSFKLLDPLFKFALYIPHSSGNLFLSCNEFLCRIYSHHIELFYRLSVDWIEGDNSFYLIIKEVEPYSKILVWGEDFKDLSFNVKYSSHVDVFGTIVLNVCQPKGELLSVKCISAFDMDIHRCKVSRITARIDCRNACKDDGVVSGQNRLQSRDSHPFQCFVYLGFLFNKEVLGWYVRFGHVIVVIAYEKFYFVFRKESLEFSVQLSNEGLVWRNDYSRSLKGAY